MATVIKPIGKSSSKKGYWLGKNSIHHQYLPEPSKAYISNILSENKGIREAIADLHLATASF